MKVYLIPPGYEAKLRPSALLSYKGKRCSPLHKRTAGLFDSVASAPESFQNFLLPSVLPLEETPNSITVFVVVVQPLGATPRAHTLGHGIQSRQQTPMTDMGSPVSPTPVLYLILVLTPSVFVSMRILDTHFTHRQNFKPLLELLFPK